MNLQRIKQLAGINLNESVQSVPGIGIVKEASSNDIQELTDMYKTGELTLDEYKDELDSLEYTNQSMQQGSDTLPSNKAYDKEQSNWTQMIDPAFDDLDNPEEYNDLDEVASDYRQHYLDANKSNNFIPSRTQSPAPGKNPPPTSMLDDPIAGITDRIYDRLTKNKSPKELDEKSAVLDTNAINDIAKLPHGAAKEKAQEMLAASTTTPDKKYYLSNQIDKTRNTMAVVKLLYDMVMAGEGNSVIGSSYGRRFNEEDLQGQPGNLENLESLRELISGIIERAQQSFMSADETRNLVHSELSDYDNISEDDIETILDEFGLSMDGEQDEGGICPACNGSGEGMYDGAICSVCRGSGEESRNSQEDDYDLEEDIGNGYNDTHCATGDDFFPNGADGPVTTEVGPSGARQGDNPEQKKMAVAEMHKELVYNYRKFLKESTTPVSPKDSKKLINSLEKMTEHILKRNGKSYEW